MDQRVEVRTRFTPDDEALSRLHGQAFGEAGQEAGEIVAWGQRLQRHSLTWAGAFVGDELVAFVHVVWDGGIHGFLLDTMVRPDHQRAGLGRAVVAAAVDGARAAGCEWLHVDYESHLEEFYRDACGFKTTSAGLMRLD
jgi:GNAT superfamily N-acetyltransferase